MNTKLYFLTWLMLIFTLPAQAQGLTYARYVIDTLCSPYMGGRGYVNEGHHRAALFIANEFKRWEADAFGENYFQPFEVDVNVFPDAMEMQVNKKTLRAGIDFLINPASAGIRGTYKVIRIKEKHLLNNKKFEQLLATSFDGKALWLNYRAKNAATLQGKLAVFKSAVKAAAYLLPEENKLTWHISGQPKYQTEITLFRKNIPRKIKTATLNIDNRFLRNYPTQNVIGYLPGTLYPDSFLVFTAHYDHLGRLGSKQYIPGANDNASGVAMLLNLMQHYAQTPHTCSVVFIAFGAEELGLLGSKYFTENPLFPLNKIGFLINLDIVGTGDDGATVVNATEFTNAWQTLVQLNDHHKLLPQLKSRTPAANSDHHWFYQNGVPCFFIYTMGGIKAYHDVYDRPQTLPLTKFMELHSLLTLFANAVQQP
ncbi:MAG TPA: M28 family peptidase [Chitinophagales bacterium]|nr:M28 family peptidase [Chitinophagales bacterium]